MKRTVLKFLLLLASQLVAWTQPTNPVQRLLLNPLAIVRIPVALDRLTTLRLPGPPSNLDAAFIGMDPHPDALFLMSYQPCSSFLSIRALVPNAKTTLNIGWKGQTFVFEFVESRNPWLSVIFEPPRLPTSTERRLVSPSGLLGLLDMAKAYGLLRQQHPEAVAGVEATRPNTLRDYGDYTIRTEEVFRFDAEDSLVFRVAISNKTSAVLHFVPESLMVRAGQRIYYQSITDATGLLPPHAELPIYFGISGSPDGSPNALSPRNDFMVLLNRQEPITSASPTSVLSGAPASRPQASQP